MDSKPLWQIGVQTIGPRNYIPAMSFEYATYNRQRLIEEQMQKQSASTAEWAKAQAVMWDSYEAHEVPYFIPAKAINRKQLLAEPDDAR